MEGVPIDEQILLNTRTESEAAIDLFKQKQVSSVYVVAPPFHQLRALMTFVTVALQEYPEVQIYSYPGKPLPWDETVPHSQGTTIDSRSNLIHVELERIRKYQRKGDLGSPRSVLDYLKSRG